MTLGIEKDGVCVNMLSIGDRSIGLKDGGRIATTLYIKQSKKKK